MGALLMSRQAIKSWVARGRVHSDRVSIASCGRGCPQSMGRGILYQSMHVGDSRIAMSRGELRMMFQHSSLHISH
jgi:hypothetical protein